MASTSAAPASQLFPLSRCPACGYDLTGLPNPGRCPECGHSYDNTTLILFGWPPDRLRIPSATALYVLGMCFGVFLCVDGAIGFVAVILSLVQGLWRNVWVAVLMTVGYSGAGAGMFVLAMWARRRRRTHNPVTLGIPSRQLQLSTIGYGTRRGYGDVQYLHWIPDIEIDLSLDGPIAHLRITRLSAVGTIDWSTVVDIAFPATADQVADLRVYLDTMRRQKLGNSL